MVAPSRRQPPARPTTLSMIIEFQGKDGNGKVEIHTLNPGTGDHIERFGGTKHTLRAHKTASIVTRTYSPNAVRDYEQDIYNYDFWEWIARIINGEIEAKVTATATPRPEEKASA